jgi:2,3-bisphosphoglycerate-dependent phosphoglycerate mutase
VARLILIRHCQSAGQEPEAPLTEAGALAAVRLAERLALLAPDAVYSSPYLRARRTVQPFADRAGLSISEDHRLHERVLSPTPLKDWLDHVRRSYDDPEHRAAPGGESFREARARGLAALADIVAAGHRLPVAVSHGALISSILHGVDPQLGFEAWRSLRNPDVFEVTFEDGRPTDYRRLD